METITTLDLSTLRKNFVILIVMLLVLLMTFGGLFYTLKQDLREIDAGIAHYKSDTKNVVGVTADYTFEGFMDFTSPQELSGQSGTVKKFTKVLVQYHDFIYAFSKFNAAGDFRSVAWLNAMGWTIMFFFMDTVLSVLFFFDDGSCGKLSTESTCLLRTSLDEMSTLCVWDATAETCSFNQDIGNSPVSCLVLTGMITIFSIPFEKLFEIMVEYCREFVVIKYLKGRNPRWRSPVDQLCLDFCSFESKRNTLLRAARLELMRRNMDDLSVHDEALRLCAEESEHAIKYSIVPEHFRGLIQDAEILHSLNVSKQLSHHYTADDRNNVKRTEKRIAKTRAKAEQIIKTLEECTTDFEREVVLVRQFQCTLLSNFRQYISQRFYDQGYLREEALKKAEITIFHYISLVLLPLYVLFTCLFVFLFGVRMGPATTYLWLKGGLIAFSMELALLKPVKITLRSIVLSQVIFPDIRVVHEHLINRARLVMARTRGLIRTHSDRIQHLNAACRAARAFPHLQVSRLLMSLNDHDFPTLLTTAPKSYIGVVYKFFSTIGEYIVLAVLLFLANLPGDVQDVFIDTAGNIFAGAIIILLALASTISIAIPLSIGGAIFLAGVISFVIMKRRHAQKVALKNASMDENELEQQAKFNFKLKHKAWRKVMDQFTSPSKKHRKINVTNLSPTAEEMQLQQQYGNIFDPSSELVNRPSKKKPGTSAFEIGNEGGGSANHSFVATGSRPMSPVQVAANQPVVSTANLAARFKDIGGSNRGNEVARAAVDDDLVARWMDIGDVKPDDEAAQSALEGSTFAEIDVAQPGPSRSLFDDHNQELTPHHTLAPTTNQEYMPAVRGNAYAPKDDTDEEVDYAAMSRQLELQMEQQQQISASFKAPIGHLLGRIHDHHSHKMGQPTEPSPMATPQNPAANNGSSNGAADGFVFYGARRTASDYAVVDGGNEGAAAAGGDVNANDGAPSSLDWANVNASDWVGSNRNVAPSTVPPPAAVGTDANRDVFTPVGSGRNIFIEKPASSNKKGNGMIGNIATADVL